MFLDILLIGIEVFLMICLLVISVFITYIIPIYGYLGDRIRNDEIGEGFIGLLTIIPKFLGIINVFYSVCFVSSIVRHPDILPTVFRTNLTVLDYLIWVIVFASMIILIELIRFIEYKVHFKIEEKIIYVDDKQVNDKDDYFIYNEKRVEVVKINNDNVISLALKPTLHGQDSIYGKNVEYIIKNIEERSKDFKLSLVPKNPVKYSFTEL